MNQLIQLYAPFAGLMALAFWMGVLSQRVSQLEKDNVARQETHDTVIELKVTVDAMKTQLDQVARSSENIKHQLTNLQLGKGKAKIYEIGGDSDG